MKKRDLLISFLLLMGFSACNDNDSSGDDKDKGRELSAEWYTGGKLGTTFINVNTSSAYEQATPIVEEDAAMNAAFMRGESLFENNYIEGTDPGAPRTGLGPAFVRNSCIACHPGYGHGKRMDRYRANDFGNGYLLVVYDKDTDAYVPELTGMPQTKAIAPFLPPVDENGIKIEWLSYTDKYGNTFPDGETYQLIYPEVTIDPAYINTDPKPKNYDVRLEATIGIYGTGLLDAIHDDSLRLEYTRQQARGYCQGRIGKDITEADGTTHPGRFTYALSRGTLQNGPGANAIWNITSVTRSDRTKNYITGAWAKAMSQNLDIQAKLAKSEEEIYSELMSQNLEPEMSDDDYIDFMIWHRGLAVPAARNLDDEEVQKGKKVFNSIGCTACHRPSWITGPDNYTGDPMVAGKLPRYPYQTIWPYSDLLQHRLEMKNNIRTGWCRTTPLWGRGLSEQCTGAGDHLHDMRARNYIEAIMWHGGEAEKSVEKFRALSKTERDAVVKFLESI
ncbi:di-heme oxidoredictase family protein [Bacteroides sp. 224]|uniref:di-heme oxidoredictase family protein n=1 Tax=Bacteroides sp. 224 TaxID=2302936 RepID=UPI0013D4A613|nr:di-heme oxidoredictase family protein [Bacteroides sp. 224]NDV65119.1 hypothetical protein [Bacteroides sp. 224]